MRWLIWTMVCLSGVAAGIASAEGEVAEQDPPLDVETILRTTVDKEDYVDVTRCIPLHKIREVKVLDEKHIAFRMGRDKYYLVQMEQRCFGLRRGSQISYETNGATVCRSDSIRAVIEIGRTAQLGPSCRIPSFQEITREQMVLIRDTLRNKK